MSNPSAPSPKADLALTVFLQDVASGRRVLWIGDASTGGAERLASMALDVRVMDTSGRIRAGRVGAARVVPFNAGRLELEDQFDLVVVPDAGVLEDLEESAREIKRALGDGLLVLGTHADEEHYERAVPALDGSFREVRLLGQAPFAASAIANLDHEASGVALDGSLLRDAPETIERYLFIAGDELPESDGLLVVQLPGGAAPAESNQREVKALRQELNRAGARLEQAQVRLVETEATLSEARARIASQDAALDAAPPAAPSVETLEEGEDIRALEATLRDRGALIRRLQADAQRHALLVRDMAEELREWTSGHRGSLSEAALDTEASLAAAQFTIDELRVEVSLLEAAAAQVPAQPEPTPEPEPEPEPQPEPQPEPEPAQPDPELIAELSRLREQVESLEGERNGLSLRLADVEASLAAAVVAKPAAEPVAPAAPAAAVSASPDQLDRLDALQEEVESLRLVNSELTISTVDLAEEKDALEARGREASSALAARDALITRLQIDLAQEENSRSIHDRQAARMNEEVHRLREAVVAASLVVDAKERAERRVTELQAELDEANAGAADAAAAKEAADQVELAQKEAAALNEELEVVREARDTAETRLGELEGELSELRKRARENEDAVAGLKTFKVRATEALNAARATLSSLRDPSFVPERSTITSAGGEAAPLPDDDSEHLTLMRSLTAQLEERNDRIRALERRVGGEASAAGDSSTDMLELEERVARFKEALEHERAARTAADERVIQLLKQAPSGPADLEQELRVKKSALAEKEQRVETLSGDVSSLRSVCAATRTGLESLLSDADADEEAARRIGELLDILRGF